MVKRLVLVVLHLGLMVLPACSWFSKNTKEPIETAPRVVQSIPAPRPATKEPGSLWSEDSRWNNIYSVTPSRMPGDLITIKVNDPLKLKIASMLDASKKPDEPRTVIDGKEPKDPKKAKEAPEKKEEGREPASVSNADKGKDDTKSIEATILEVLPNGFYRVGFNRAFRIGKEEPFVTVEGSIREKEISNEEVVSSDSLLNLKIDTYDENKALAKAAEEKKLASSKDEKK